MRAVTSLIYFLGVIYVGYGNIVFLAGQSEKSIPYLLCGISFLLMAVYLKEK